jgi:arylsulfatase A-like enzyme
LNPAVTRWLPRASVTVLVVTASLLAWKVGGGADARTPAPHVDVAAAPSDATPGHGAAAYEVTTRLVDELGTAHVQAPSLPAAQPFMVPYWRKMHAPWAHLSGTAAQLGFTLAIRTSRAQEKQLAVPTQAGAKWVPQARIWNMNEGSFDQRECIFAPTPASLSFSLDVPPRARLRLSPAVLTPMSLTTVFDVSVVDTGGGEQSLKHLRVDGADARKWIDLDLDLAPWGGHKVTLVLRTSTDAPAPDEKRWTLPLAEEASPDGGLESAPAAPPMSLALWGDPVVVAEQPTRVPYNVLWFVVDALRPDVVASLHDPAEDAAKLAAPRPPLDALLPAVPGLVPNIDRLVARGVHFTHAWSAATWTRAGTLAMLSGERSSELGIDTRDWVLPPEGVARYYHPDPPMLPLLLRRVGADATAFVNNFFMAGYVPVGVDMGFERVTDHRYRTRDTDAIAGDALAWLDTHKGDRFFLVVNTNSPHEPYDPPKELLARVPRPPAGPRDAEVRAYMAEAAKDDAAIGRILDAVDAMGLTKSTLVVLTADHGETLSSAHDAVGFEDMPMRFHHAIGNFEETTRIPIVLALPGVLDGGRAVADRVRNIDIAPTVLELEGLEADPRMSGKSLMPLVRGEKEPEPRVVVTEGRGTRGILWDHWHLVAHEDSADDELYDLRDDPGERHDVAKRPLNRDVVAELRARLNAALANVKAADAKDSGAPTSVPVIHMVFAGAGRAHRVTGTIAAGDGKHGVTLRVVPVGIAGDVVRLDGPTATFALTTAPDALVGLDLRVDPPGAPVSWKLYLDDAPWPDGGTYAGPFGLPAVASRTGIAGDDARAEAYAASAPMIDPARDLGVFVTRDRPQAVPAGSPANPAPQAAAEMQQVLQQWGYAHGSH